MSKIVSTGSYLPDHVVTNTDLVEQTGIDSSDEWIRQRTGIEQRHFAEADQSLAEMMTEAARAAIDRMENFDKQDINLIIVATMSSGLPTPSLANQVQANLGIDMAWSFDLSGACTGFNMALEAGEKISRTYSSGYSLIIGGEKMSDILDFSDRSTSILFGDGAGAVLIENDGQGLPAYASEMASVPDEKGAIVVNPDNDQASIAMGGRDVFNFVVRQVVPSLKDFIDEHAQSFDYLLSHQANSRLIDIMVTKLKTDPEKVPVNIDRVANTSAGSIPILLDELVEKGDIRLENDQRIVFAGFGGGLSWGHVTLMI